MIHICAAVRLVRIVVVVLVFVMAAVGPPAYGQGLPQPDTRVFLVVVADESGSIRPLIQKAQIAIERALAGSLVPGDGLAIVSFNSKARLRDCREVATLRDVLDAVSLLAEGGDARGNTRISAGVERAVAVARERANGRNVVGLLITDGKDTAKQALDGTKETDALARVITQWRRLAPHTVLAAVATDRRVNAPEVQRLASLLGVQVSALEDVGVRPVLERRIIDARQTLPAEPKVQKRAAEGPKAQPPATFSPGAAAKADPSRFSLLAPYVLGGAAIITLFIALRVVRRRRAARSGRRAAQSDPSRTAAWRVEATASTAGRVLRRSALLEGPGRSLTIGGPGTALPIGLSSAVELSVNRGTFHLRVPTGVELEVDGRRIEGTEPVASHFSLRWPDGHAVIAAVPAGGAA